MVLVGARLWQKHQLAARVIPRRKAVDDCARPAVVVGQPVPVDAALMPSTRTVSEATGVALVEPPSCPAPGSNAGDADIEVVELA